MGFLEKENIHLHLHHCNFETFLFETKTKNFAIEYWRHVSAFALIMDYSATQLKNFVNADWVRCLDFVNAAYAESGESLEEARFYSS